MPLLKIRSHHPSITRVELDEVITVPQSDWTQLIFGITCILVDGEVSPEAMEHGEVRVLYGTGLDIDPDAPDKVPFADVVYKAPLASLLEFQEHLDAYATAGGVTLRDTATLIESLLESALEDTGPRLFGARRRIAKLRDATDALNLATKAWLEHYNALATGRMGAFVRGLGIQINGGGRSSVRFDVLDRRTLEPMDMGARIVLEVASTIIRPVV